MIDLGSDNDVCIAGPTSEDLHGRSGDDKVDYSRSTSSVDVRLHYDTAAGGYADGHSLNSFEHIQGSNHDDILVGGLGDNRLEGLAGADRMYGMAGNDFLLVGLAASDFDDTDVLL